MCHLRGYCNNSYCCKTLQRLHKNAFRLSWQADKSNFRLAAYRKETSLSGYVWKLQDAGTEYSLTWKIIDRVQKSSISSKNCNLCATEKLRILEMDDDSRINKFSELLSRCRHKDMFKLKSIKYTKEIDLLSHTIQKEQTMRPTLRKIDNILPTLVDMNPQIILSKINVCQAGSSTHSNEVSRLDPKPLEDGNTGRTVDTRRRGNRTKRANQLYSSDTWTK